MKNSFRVIATTLALVSFCFGSKLLACGGENTWSESIDSVPQSTISQVIEKAKAKGFLLEDEKDYTKCQMSGSYSLIDIETDIKIVSIPIPLNSIKADDGRYLEVRFEQVLKTPREQLLSLTKARKDFLTDSMAIEEELKIDFYEMTTFVIAKEVDLYVSTDTFCSVKLYKEKVLSFENIIDIDFTVPAFRYMPGRSNYEPTSIYQKGDLGRRLFANKELLEKLAKLNAINAKSCNPKHFDIKGFLERELFFRLALEKLN